MKRFVLISEGWPAVLRLALNGGKVSISFSIGGAQIGGSDLQKRTSRTLGPPVRMAGTSLGLGPACF
jgi:hypothetical protein